MASKAETRSKRATTHDRPAPTQAAARLDSLDVLRGIAVLMIFVVNVKMMANGYNHYVNRSLWDGQFAHWIAFIQGEFIHGKFVTIFTALFGAGLALLLARDNPMPMPVVLRRLFWLTVFALLHLFFLREGDILIWYALAGFIALPFVRLSGSTLLVVGLALQIAAYIYASVVPLTGEGVPILWSTAPDAHLKVADIMRGTIIDQIAARIDAAPYYIIELFITGGVWLDTLSVMIIGMGLLKTGFLRGQRPMKSYILWGTLGLVVAAADYVLPALLGSGSDHPAWQSELVNIIGHFHCFGGALAYSSLIVGAVSAGWKPTAFAAAGRMALTIYIFSISHRPSSIFKPGTWPIWPALAWVPHARHTGSVGVFSDCRTNVVSAF